MESCWDDHIPQKKKTVKWCKIVTVDIFTPGNRKIVWETITEKTYTNNCLPIPEFQFEGNILSLINYTEQQIS